MTAVALVTPRYQFHDANGNPLAGGTVDMYIAGTTTRTDTWQDRDALILNTNPIVLDGNGSCSIRIERTLAYKMVVKDVDGATQPHLGGDNIIGVGSSEDLAIAGSAAVAGLQTLFNIMYLTGN